MTERHGNAEPGQWKPAHEAHLQRLLAWVCMHVDRKYRRGQAEHGGNLWEAPGLLTELHAETFDLLAYGQALDEHAARIFQDVDAGRVTPTDALAQVRVLLWGERSTRIARVSKMRGEEPRTSYGRSE